MDFILNIYKLYSFIYYKAHSVKSFFLAQTFSKCGCNILFRRIGKLSNPQYIEIGENVDFGDDIYLTAWKVDDKIPKIIIGSNCSFGAFNHISASNLICIGNNVLTGKNVSIIDNSHGETDCLSMTKAPRLRKVVSKGPIVIEDMVWIGEKVTILSNVKIGHNSIIAANAVVTKDIPPFSIAAGIPAQVLRSNKD